MNVNKKINEEMRESAPLLSDKIADSVDWESIAAENAAPAKKTAAKSRKPVIWSIAAACCAAALCLGLLIPSFFMHSAAPSGETETLAYAVTIEVNPSVRLEVGSNDTVIRQYGLNEDGVLLLHKENFVGKNVDEATEAIVRKLEKRGFLKSNTVKVCVKDASGKTDKNKQTEVTAAMESYLASLGSGSLELMDEKEFERIEHEFKDKDLSEYEKSLIVRYKETVLTLARQKGEDFAALIAVLNPYADKGNKNPIENPPFIDALDAFAKKYKYEFDFEADEISGRDVYETVKDLADDYEDLTEAIEELEEGKNGDDYKDLLEDIYELAEDFLFEEED